MILRGNRFLGSTLVDKGLVSVKDLELANEKFMSAIQDSDLKQASILSTLLFDLKVLDETALLDHLVKEHNLGLIDLAHVELSSLRAWHVDFSLCWATSTIPFDKVENTYMVASCYYMSAPVVKHWEGLLDGEVIWYGTSAASITRGLEQVEEIHKAEDEAAAEED